MNILISYLTKDVPMPEEVKLKTTRCRDSNDEFTEWLKEAIEEREDSYLTLQTILQHYGDDTIRGPKAMGKYKISVVQFLLKNFGIPENNCSSRRIPGHTKNSLCWKGIAIKDEFR
jgi:hypothetical protein